MTTVRHKEIRKQVGSLRAFGSAIMQLAGDYTAEYENGVDAEILDTIAERIALFAQATFEIVKKPERST